MLARSGWKTIADALRLLPGPTIEEVQQIPLGLRKRRKFDQVLAQEVQL